MSSSTQALELQSIENPDNSVTPQREDDSITVIEANNGSSLPPTDRGKDAWLFLFSTFMLEALIWGFPSSYGVFQEYYSSHEPFAGSSNIAVVGACAMVCFFQLERYIKLTNAA